jgi:YD repeat-containing protein
MTKIILAIAMLAASFSFASAQTTQSYGPAGQYQGSTNTFGNTTQSYGPAGQYQGSTNTYGNTTQSYGPAGQYQGSTQTQSGWVRPFHQLPGFVVPGVH